DSYTRTFLTMPAKEAKLLISMDEYPLAVALNDGKSWKCASFLLRKPTADIFEKLEDLDAEVLQEERTEWEAAVREHYSLRIAKEVTPSMEDFTPTRVLAISDLLKERWKGAEGEVCLDACCGSGVGSVALRDLGMVPLSFDNDPALLSLGLRTGRLLPEETVCIDGTRASSYLKHSHFGIMLMAGEIGPHSSVIWKKITSEMLEVADHLIVTVGTEREARLLEAWAKERKRKAEVLENTREAFYDNWVCDIRRM
ncbi:MAG: hypothetical protein LUQ16_06220, partial [Methanomassiliicoccales archaeon]|nr:hypothetical protein [Methanomassiliicoccales archaeon]